MKYEETTIFRVSSVIPRDDSHKFRKIVTIILDNLSPQVKKYLHCLNCGHTVANYYNEERIIIMGEVLEVARPIDIMCEKCRTLYRIA